LNGRNCYCGNDPNRYDEFRRKHCDKTCDYDSELACGGDNFNSVFKTDANSKSMQVTVALIFRYF